MVKAIAPRNLVVLRRPGALDRSGGGAAAAPAAGPTRLQALLDATLRGRFSHVHMPQQCEVVKMASTAAFAATMTQELSQRIEEAPKVCGHTEPPSTQRLGTYYSCFVLPATCRMTGPVSVVTGLISVKAGPVSVVTGLVSVVAGPVSVVTGLVSDMAGLVSVVT